MGAVAAISFAQQRRFFFVNFTLPWVAAAAGRGRVAAGRSRPRWKEEKENGWQSFEPYPNALRKSIIPFRGMPPLTLMNLFLLRGSAEFFEITLP